MKLSGATFLLQWATGGLAFCWVTTRRREVGLGYGWLLRIVYGLMAVGAAAWYAADGGSGAAHAAALGGSVLVSSCAAGALASSVVRRGAGVRGQSEDRERKRARVASMLGDDADPPSEVVAAGREFDPRWDLPAPVVGCLALLAAAELAGGPYALAAARLLVGAAFVGVVTDAMLLGHWYLVQPGLRRDPVKELVRITMWVWPVEVLVFLWPPGMVDVLTGEIDDGYGGLLGWVWAACVGTTIVLVGMTWAALKERSYSAVMAATGLMYLAILTAFGMDLVARAVLAP